MKIQSEFSSSRAHFLRVLNYGRDLYCKGDPNIIKYWPKTWQDCISLLSGEGTLRQFSIGLVSIESIHAAMISQIHQKNCASELVYGISFKKYLLADLLLVYTVVYTYM